MASDTVHSPPSKQFRRDEGHEGPRSGDDSVSLPNPHLDTMESDFLYHIGYYRSEARELFGDVKYVVMGGSANRMRSFAECISKELDIKGNLDFTRTDRYSFFKIGPVLSISHGMGVPSLTILLHELFKLLTYANATDAIFIRIGTSGGLDVPPGTLVITDKAYNTDLKLEHQTVILGRTVSRPSMLDKGLAQSILSCQDDSTFKTLIGGTMCIHDFYEGQARLDGAICEYSEDEKSAYLDKIRKAGVINIEMDCTALASLCKMVGFKCAIVNVTLVDRFSKDQVKIGEDTYKAFQMRHQALVAKFIKSRLAG